MPQLTLFFFVNQVIFNFALIILVLSIGFIIFNKNIRNNLDILPIIFPNECKVISSNLKVY